MSERAGQREWPDCLYCDKPSGSLEHIIASGIGGQLRRRTLVCGTHNGRCGEWCDKPLAEQFAFAVHALEVLQRDKKSRGTKWMGLHGEDGTIFDVLSDFRFAMRYPKVTSGDDGSFIVEGTPANDVSAQHEGISAVADLSSTRVEIRPTRFAPLISSRGPGLRGVLKAALHFVALITRDRARASAVCRELASELFSDAEPTRVTQVPYYVGDDRLKFNRVELLAWNQDDETLVRVKLFNVITYCVRLPFIPITPRVFEQNTWDGSTHEEVTQIPELKVYADQATPEGFRREFARRVDAIASLAMYKSDIVDILNGAVNEFSYRSQIEIEARVQWLGDAIREGIRVPTQPTPTWVLREAMAFADRRIAEIAREALS
jgi:hypothetical protein